MEEKLLYTSKGVSPEKRSKGVIALVVVVVGTVLMAWFGMKSIRDNRMFFTDGEEALASLFVWLLISACVAMLVKQVMFLKNQNAFYVKLFEHHLEAFCMDIYILALGRTKTLQVSYVNIDRLEIEGENLAILVGGQREQLICDDVQKVYELLSQLVVNAQRGPDRSASTSSPVPGPELKPEAAPPDQGRVRCPKCGTLQNADREKCWKCSAPLKGK